MGAASVPGRRTEVVETPHFRVRGTTVEPRFPRARVDNELADHIAAELVPLGLVPDGHAFERIFVDTVLGDPAAATPAAAWAAFYRNTLRRLRRPGPGCEDSVSVFARIYAHTASLVRGTSVLDVGCCFGFLPLLLAERDRRFAVVGCDLVAGTAVLAGSVARSLRSGARFLSGDALRLPVRTAAVDTVLSVHVLEHLPAESTGRALGELCRAARRRVVVAVPVEDVPDPTYGHLQAFGLPGLAALGEATGWPWTVHGYEGGWLVLDRPGAASATAPTCPIG